MVRRGIGSWVLLTLGWLLLLYLVYAQAIPAFGYQYGVAMGTQEPSQVVTEVGVAFWYGFAFGDLVIYIPFLAAGLLGYGMRKSWGRLMLVAALGITAYWPVVCLSTLVAARNAEGWHLGSETGFWIVLPLVALWGVWGVWFLAREGSFLSGRASLPG